MKNIIKLSDEKDYEYIKSLLINEDFCNYIDNRVENELFFKDHYIDCNCYDGCKNEEIRTRESTINLRTSFKLYFFGLYFESTGFIKLPSGKDFFEYEQEDCLGNLDEIKGGINLYIDHSASDFME